MATPIFNQGETFYVPTFRIKVSGQSLDPMVVRDIVQVTYKDRAEELDSVELTINNWDSRRMKPKYEPPSIPSLEGVFDPGKSIELVMGYAGNARNDRVMMNGEIVSLEPVFPESGSSTLHVRALNVLNKFRKKQHTWAWYDNKRDSEIAREICRNKVTDNRPGLDIGIDIDDSYQSKEQPQPFVFMNNQYDINFLLERARINGYSLYLKTGQDGKDVLNFKASERLRDVTYELAWGASLCEFRPTLTTANQLQKVTVHGWDRKAGRPIVVTKQWGDADVKINIDQRSVARVVEGREEVVTDHPVFSKAEAENLARSTLKNQLYEMVKASGSTVGLPDLRSGRRLVISKLGPRFSGSYFVTETSHVIGESGYRTTFSARREGPEAP